MAADLRISAISFNDGSTLSMSNNDIVVFTGGNNVGKSAVLKNIGSQLLAEPNTSYRVVTNVDIIQSDSASEAFQLLSKYYPSDDNYIVINGSHIPRAQAENWWDQGGARHFYTRIFLRRIFTDQRLITSNTQQQTDSSQGISLSPVHRLYQVGDLEEEVSKLFKEAFGLDLMINRNAGMKITLHVGNRPQFDPSDKYLTNYYTAVNALPLLQEQGDGMRSFVTILLELSDPSATIFLLDEPESFLHPPQIKLLGKFIVSRFKDRQLLIATHSSDFIKSLLEGNLGRVSIVKLQRDKVVNHPLQINNKNIASIWKDPVLSYSSIFEGLFHEKVVICESDGDCRFFTAIIEELYKNKPDYSRIPDTLFIPSHGKAKMPSIVTSLRSIAVPVISICDFDIFNNENPLKELVLAHGGDWNIVEPIWRIFYQGVNQQKAQLDRDEVSQNLSTTLSAAKTASLSHKEIEQLRTILKASTAWSYAKQQGIDFLPAGDCRLACEGVVQYLNSIGIFPLLIGELESFDKSVGNSNKAKWLDLVLQKDLATHFETAKIFLKSVMSYESQTHGSPLGSDEPEQKL